MDEWKEKDPLKRFREWMQENDIWSEELKEYGEEGEQKVQEAAEEAMEMDEPGIDELFDYVYEETPEMLEDEKRKLERELSSGGEE